MTCPCVTPDKRGWETKARSGYWRFELVICCSISCQLTITGSTLGGWVVPQTQTHSRLRSGRKLSGGTFLQTISQLSLPLLPNDSVNREMQSMREKFNFQITRGQQEPHIEFLSEDIKSSRLIWIRQACTEGRTGAPSRASLFWLSWTVTALTAAAKTTEFALKLKLRLYARLHFHAVNET